MAGGSGISKTPEFIGRRQDNVREGREMERPFVISEW